MKQEKSPTIWFVTAEAAPFAKVGGLGDVSGELPQALRAQGQAVILCMPLHGVVKVPDDATDEEIHGLPGWVGAGRVFRWRAEGMPVQAYQLPRWFGRPHVYGDPDDGERFAAFCLAVALHATQTAEKPRLLHLQDWHAAPIAMLVQAARRDTSTHPLSLLGGVKTLLTMHSLQYQGWRPASFCYFFDVGMDLSSVASCFPNGFNAMRAGILWADALNTVSPTHAVEIREKGGGFGLEADLASRWRQLGARRYCGILNRIGAKWDPDVDEALPVRYNQDSLVLRTRNRTALHEVLGLPVEDAPLAAFVGRLSDGKGLEVLTAMAPACLRDGMRLVVLGVGEPRQEALLEALKQHWPTRVAWQRAFLPDLARCIYGGADILLMPSAREACGISQQIAMRYGCVPVAHKTGGLADTILDGETGFLYVRQTPAALERAVRRAWNEYRHPEIWEMRMREAMHAAEGWVDSAANYARLYDDLLQEGAV